MEERKTYESLGFVEALIAIIVVGASSVVLMQIAVSTMQNMIQNDTIDKMTQYAVEGAEMAQDIANKDKAFDENLFPDSADVFVGRECFVLMIEVPEDEDSPAGGYYFLRNNEAGFVTYTYGESSEYKTTAKIPSDDELFRIVCLQYPERTGYTTEESGSEGAITEGSASSEESTEDPRYVTAKVIVGQVNSDGTITKGNLVKDYTYFSVIKL